MRRPSHAERACKLSSQKSSSKTSETKKLKTSNDKKKASNRKMGKSLLLLLFAFSLAQQARRTSSTSQISAIWLARDGDQPFGAELHAVLRQPSATSVHVTTESTSKQDNATLNEQRAEKRIGEMATGSGRDALTKPIHITTAASSLQPSIVSIEPIDQEEHHSQSVSKRAQRRSGSNGSGDGGGGGGGLSKPLRFKLAHIEPTSTMVGDNLTYSLDNNENLADNFWSSSSLNSSGLLQQNSQVHFDEENLAKRGDNSVTIELAPVVQSGGVSSRFQDNETTSILTPQHHEAPAPALQTGADLAVHFDDQHHSSGEFGATLGERRNASKHHGHLHQTHSDTDTAVPFDDSEHQKFGVTAGEIHKDGPQVGALHNESSAIRRQQPMPVPPIYYLPNGDKWNSNEFQQQLNEVDDRRHWSKYSSAPPPVGGAHEQWTSKRLQQQQNLANFHSNNHMGQFKPFQKATSVQQQWQHERPVYQAAPHTTVLPRVWRHFSSKSPLDGPLLVQHPDYRHHYGHADLSSSLRQRQQWAPPSGSLALDQLVAGGYQPARATTGRRRPSLANGHRELTRVSAQTTSPRRKSILSRLNNWAGVSQPTSNELDKVSLENAFYGGRPVARRGRRPSTGPMRNSWPQPISHYGGLPGREFEFHRLPYGSVQQPTVAPVAGALNHMALGGSQRYRQPFGLTPTSGAPGRQSGILQSPSQQPASFIPVVALQVTRTSPAPILPVVEADQHQTVGDDAANEIDQYLETKTGMKRLSRRGTNHRNNSGQQQQFTHWDNLSGDQTSATNNRQTAGSATSNSMRHQLHTIRPTAMMGQSNGGQETTVTKSAVFGYLPHQADGPLLQAMNALQQIPAPNQAGAGGGQHHSSGSNSNKAHQSSLLSQHNNYNELFANQMDRSNQATDAATHYIDQHAYLAALPQLSGASISQANQLEAESPSLALQLQANNYIQNEIAHPFATNALFGSNIGDQQARNLLTGDNQPVGYSTSEGAQIRPLEVVYPSEQYLQQQQQLFSAYLGEQQRLQQHAPTKFHHLHHHHHQQQQQQQFASSDMNPLLQQHQQMPTAYVFAAPAGMTQLDTTGQSSTQVGALGDANQLTAANLDESAQTNGEVQSVSNGAPTTTSAQSDESLGSDALAEADLNKSASKGKKRSSDFFANAGQLLLSALPLLLAPTLGLMFAASPSKASLGPQVARLHQSSSAAPTMHMASNYNHETGGWTTGASQGAPSAYSAASLDSGGLVSNPSPSPQLFTPMPPGSGGGYATAPPPNQMHEQITGSKLEPQSSLEQQSQVARFERNRTHQHQLQMGGSTNKGVTLPALTGLKMDSMLGGKSGGVQRGSIASSSTSSTTSSTTTQRPTLKRLILTTLSPPQWSNKSDSLSEEEAKNYLASGHDLLLELAATNGANNSDNVVRHYISDGNTNRTSTASSIVILSAEPEESAHDANKSDEDKSEIELDEHKKAIGQFKLAGNPASSANKSAIIHYDISYEGADFDAQFPSLNSNGRLPTGRPTAAAAEAGASQQQQPQMVDIVKDKSRYKYSVTPESTAGGDSRRRRRPILGTGAETTTVSPQQVPSTEQQSHTDERLFPVSNWPPLRRRTVSLVTSQGNRTLYDSSHKYVSNTEPARQLASASVQMVTSQLAKQQQQQQQQVNNQAASIPVGAQREAVAQLLDSFLLERPKLVARNAAQDEQDLNFGDYRDARRLSLRYDRLLKRHRRQVDAGDSLQVQAEAHLVASSSPENGNEDQSGTSTAQNKKNKKKRRKRVVVKRMKIKRQGFEPVANQAVAAETNSTEELLNRDSSRHKSAIVTAMITHLGQPDASLESVDELGEPEGQPLDEERARAQLLHRKMLLERLATRNNELDENFPSGPGQIGPIAPSTRSQAMSNSSRLRKHPYLVSDRLTRQQDLPDDTRRALAKFGSLLLEDTLQIAGSLGQDHKTRKQAQNSSVAALALDSAEDEQTIGGHHHQLNETISAATERYSARPTQQPRDEWAHRTTLNDSAPAYNESYYARPAVYQHPSRQRAHSFSNQHETNDTSEMLSRHYQQQFGERYTSDYRNRAHQQQASTDSPMSSYNQFLQSHLSRGSRDAHNKSAEQLDKPGQNKSLLAVPAQQADQLDARFSTYSNYSTPNSPEYNSYYSGRREMPPFAPAPPQHAPQNGYVPHADQAVADYPQRPLGGYGEQQHYNYSAYGPQPAYYARNEYQAPPPAYHGQPPPPPQVHTTSNYAPTSGYEGAYTGAGHGGYGSRAPAPQPLHLANSFHLSSNPLHEASDSSADPSRSVNDYLKRVQFSDSDRDKLMASYLTCDGLLNDNDHCLERLSCEFSDPLNIEKANKLDRAVSSILLGHILINTYIPNSFKLRLKSASLFGYTQSGKCSKFACNKLSNNLKN